MNRNNNNMDHALPAGRVSVSAAAFGAKYRSKRECFNFLAVECNVYLPAYGKCFSPNSKPLVHLCLWLL